MVCHLLAACWNFFIIFTAFQLDNFAIRGKTRYTYSQGWREQSITQGKGIRYFDIHNYSGGRPCQSSYGGKGWNDNIKMCLDESKFVDKSGNKLFQVRI
jgi:hypothetical protein